MAGITKDKVYNFLLEMAEELGEAEVKRGIRKFNNRKQRAISGGTNLEKRRSIPKTWVRKAYDRQLGLCARCGEEMDIFSRDSRDQVTGDHIEPISTGGEHRSINIAAMHQRCNSAKGNRSLYEDAKAENQILTERIKLLHSED